MHAVPGDPLRGETRRQRSRSAPTSRRATGSTGPCSSSTSIYIGNMLRGDFGISFTQQNRRVNDIIREHFPVSATLGILAIVVRGVRRRRCGAR